MVRRIGIDLGTSFIRIYSSKQGVVVNEPNVVALNVSTQKVVAVGDEAKSMLGRTHENLIASSPLENGVISSFKTTKQMLAIYLNKILGRFRLFKPEIIVNVPVGATSTEKKAVLDAIESIGVKKVYLIKSPLAAAIGAGLDVSSSSGNMIINIGGGKTEVAVIALGDIVSYASVRFGGKNMDQAIIDYIRKKKNLLLGEQSAEFLKIKIGAAMFVKKEGKLEISGSNTISGLPESIIIETPEIVEALKPVLNEIILAVKQVLQKTPPELSSDVMDKGIVMSGGGAKLKNLDELMTKVTGVPCQVADDPELCTIKGIGIAVENFNDYLESLIWKKN
jgi:rod shape-determining protein MreB